MLTVLERNVAKNGIFHFNIMTMLFVSILVMWLECQFLDTDVDGFNSSISMLCP